jgi:alkylhydroperoxidase family enzyme
MGSAVGRKTGLVTEQQLHDLPTYRSSPAFSSLEKLVLDYSVGLSRTPVEISDELFAELKRHFDEPQVVELTAAIAWENYRARFNHAFGIQSQNFSEGAYCPIPESRELSSTPRKDWRSGTC